MRIIRLLVIALIVGVTACTTFNGWNKYVNVQIIENLPQFGTFLPFATKHNPVIRIVGNGLACSAVVVDARYAFTAAHCLVSETFKLLEKDARFMVYNDVGEFTGVIAKPAAVSLYEDVGLLIGDFSEFIPAPIDMYGEVHLPTNYPVLVMGYPSNQTKLYKTINYMVGHSDFRLIAVGGLILQGCSGGPVVDLQTGKVVGVISAVGGQYNFFGPIMSMLSKFGVAQ